MRIKGLIIIAIVFIVLIIGIYKLVFLRSKNLGGLKVNTNPPANIFLDEKLVGNTPYEEKINEGEYILKLIPSDSNNQSVSWQGKIKINPSLLTFVNRELGPSELTSGGEILTLEKSGQIQPQIEISTLPDAATVLVDGQERGVAPLTVTVTEGEHDIAVSSPGFTGRTIRVQTTNNYKLSINFQLILTETEIKESPDNVQPKTEIKPTLAKTGVMIKIKDTPTGFLRVRSNSSTQATELTQVKPGGTYILVEEKEGWYKIVYEEGKEGWVSSRYAEKIE